MFADSVELYLWIFSANVVAFALYGYDKHQAHYHEWRIPEIVLLLAAVPLSAFGALCGMVIFSHKTRKTLFLVAIPVLLLLQVLGMAYYFTHY